MSWKHNRVPRQAFHQPKDRSRQQRRIAPRQISPANASIQQGIARENKTNEIVTHAPGRMSRRMNYLDGPSAQSERWLILKRAKGRRWLDVLAGEPHRVQWRVAQQPNVVLVDVACHAEAPAQGGDRPHMIMVGMCQQDVAQPRSASKHSPDDRVRIIAWIYQRHFS